MSYEERLDHLLREALANKHRRVDVLMALKAL